MRSLNQLHEMVLCVCNKQDSVSDMSKLVMQKEINPSLSELWEQMCVYFVNCVLPFVLALVQFWLISYQFFCLSFYYYSVYPTVQLYPHSE